MSAIYTNNNIKDILTIFPRFPNIFRRFPKIFENSPNTARSSYEHLRSFSEHFRRCAKIFEDYRRLPNISDQSSKMIRSCRYEFRFVLQLNLINLIASATSLLSSHVKMSNLSSHVKISFHSKRNPCNSLKFM